MANEKSNLLLLVSCLLFTVILAHSLIDKPRLENKDIGPDTCGQDRKILGQWFQSHGGFDLISDPRPPLVNFLGTDPYDDPSNPPLQPDEISGFCAMQWQEEVDEMSGNRKYKLANFESEMEATEAGWTVTHRGQCAACSILQDLGVYISRNLTDETRRCGLEGTFLGQQHVLNCLKEIGFSNECAKIWQYNIKHTKAECFSVCIWAWITNEPFNKPDGSLSDCIQCDEDKSGPNFKYFSGRTRRNSGIPSSIYRPPQTVYNMTHCYWYGDLSS